MQQESEKEVFPNLPPARENGSATVIRRSAALPRSCRAVSAAGAPARVGCGKVWPVRAKTPHGRRFR
jgi:hypothetical protein